MKPRLPKELVFNYSSCERKGDNFVDLKKTSYSLRVGVEDDGLHCAVMLRHKSVEIQVVSTTQIDTGHIRITKRVLLHHQAQTQETTKSDRNQEMPRHTSTLADMNTHTEQNRSNRGDTLTQA